MSYTLTQAEYRAMKSRLTRAENSGDPHKVLAEANTAFAVFEAKGWPDDWSRWERAAQDADFTLSRGR